jgi:Flp pilus assembly pilin Flp
MQMKKMIDSIRNRFDALRADEQGMEAAQVILILVIVVVALIPLINGIVSSIQKQGSTASTAINNA